jgi:hypothetical protein
MKSKDSFNRVINQYTPPNVEWEEYVSDIEEIQEKIVFKEYDLAIVDEKIWWKDEAIELFNRKGVEVIIFQGDFEEVLEKVKELIPEEQEEEFEIEEFNEEVLNFSTEEQEVKVKEVEKTEDTREVKYIHTKEYIDRPVNVPVPVYKSMYTSIGNKLIVIANLSKRAGATFLTLNLAKAIADLDILVSIIEPPIDLPYIFDTIGLENRLNDISEDAKGSLNYYSYPHEILEKTKIKKERETINDGIVWMVPDSRKPIIPKWDYYNMMKLIYASRKASVTLIDAGDNLEHEAIKPILSEADLVLIVVDPLPTECMQNNDKLEELIMLRNKEGVPIQFAINHWNTGVDKKQFIDFLKVEPMMYIPQIDSNYIYKSIYDCKIPYDDIDVKMLLDKPFYYVIKNLIPKELLSNLESKKEEKTSLKDKVFKIFRGE